MGAEELRDADAVTRLVDHALESVGGTCARLFLSAEDGLRMHTARNARKEDLRREDVDAAGIANRVLRESRSFGDIQIRTSDRYVSISPGLHLEEFSVLAAPLRRGDVILGVLYVDATAKHKVFTAEDLRVVEAAADELAAALEARERGT
jgi:GAF domain-containing protein